MRLFLAVDLDEHLRRAASRELERLRLAIAVSDRREVKWVEPANLHVTLHFMGEIADSRLPTLVDVLSPPLATPGFEMGLGRGGVFPSQGPPRVIWIGVAPGALALRSVHRELADRLGQAAIEVDSRPMQGHVTMARVRGPIGSELRALAAGVRLDDAGCCLVEAVTLYRSHLGPGGATYAPQLTIPLGGSQVLRRE